MNKYSLSGAVATDNVEHIILIDLSVGLYYLGPIRINRN